MIEQVIIKKTLKAGKNVWLEGSVLTSPLPKVLIEEVERQTGTVEVVKGDQKSDITKTIFVAKRVDEKSEISTATSLKVESSKVNEPRPKLRRRK